MSEPGTAFDFVTRAGVVEDDYGDHGGAMIFRENDSQAVPEFKPPERHFDGLTGRLRTGACHQRNQKKSRQNLVHDDQLVYVACSWFSNLLVKTKGGLSTALRKRDCARWMDVHALSFRFASG